MVCLISANKITVSVVTEAQNIEALNFLFLCPSHPPITKNYKVHLQDIPQCLIFPILTAMPQTLIQLNYLQAWTPPPPPPPSNSQIKAHAIFVSINSSLAYLEISTGFPTKFRINSV